MKKAAKEEARSSQDQGTTTQFKFIPKIHPNEVLNTKIEKIVKKMKRDSHGILFKTKNSDVFRGKDLVLWLMSELKIDEEPEAAHLGSLIAAHGYFFQVNSYMNVLKNDNTLHRFQNPDYWPSKDKSAKNSDYAVYLCKRNMQNKVRMELLVHEDQWFEELQETLSTSWNQIEKRAQKELDAQRKREKKSRKVAESEERAFWNFHRPMPGVVNTTEVDIKKKYHSDQQRNKAVYSSYSPVTSRKANKNTEQASVQILNADIARIQERLRTCNVSRHTKTVEHLHSYATQHSDPILNNSPHPIWDRKASTHRKLTDDGDYNVNGELSFGELLKDPRGRDEFRKFLHSEYSAENLDFWLDCKKLKSGPQKDMKRLTNEIFEKYIRGEGTINIDFKVRESVVGKLKSPKTNRYCFEDAQQQIYALMKNDSYARFLKSMQDKKSSSAGKSPTQRSISTSVALLGSNLQHGDKRFGGSARQLASSSTGRVRRNSADC